MLRFLIADDYEMIRTGIKQILLETFLDAYVEEVADSISLVNKACDGKWDFVITDLMMPGGSSIEAVHKIKQKVPEIPILVISIYPEDQYANRLKKAGANGYLQKDLIPEKLVTMIEQILHKN